MWTCLEHVLVNNTDLMMDRHLDQILMCAVYVMAKVSNISASTTGFGAQLLSGRELDSRPRGRGFESHWRHCVVVLEQDTFTLA